MKVASISCAKIGLHVLYYFPDDEKAAWLPSAKTKNHIRLQSERDFYFVVVHLFTSSTLISFPCCAVGH